MQICNMFLFVFRTIINPNAPICSGGGLSKFCGARSKTSMPKSRHGRNLPHAQRERQRHRTVHQRGGQGGGEGGESRWRRSQTQWIYEKNGGIRESRLRTTRNPHRSGEHLLLGLWQPLLMILVASKGVKYALLSELRVVYTSFA